MTVGIIKLLALPILCKVGILSMCEIAKTGTLILVAYLWCRCLTDLLYLWAAEWLSVSCLISVWMFISLEIYQLVSHWAWRFIYMDRMAGFLTGYVKCTLFGKLNWLHPRRVQCSTSLSDSGCFQPDIRSWKGGPVVCRLPSAVCRLPSAVCRLPCVVSLSCPSCPDLIKNNWTHIMAQGSSQKRSPGSTVWSINCIL